MQQKCALGNCNVVLHTCKVIKRQICDWNTCKVIYLNCNVDEKGYEMCKVPTKNGDISRIRLLLTVVIYYAYASIPSKTTIPTLLAFKVTRVPIPSRIAVETPEPGRVW